MILAVSLGMAAPAARADLVQFTVPANADVVAEVAGSAPSGIDSAGRAFFTGSRANQFNPGFGNGLPDNGSFAVAGGTIQLLPYGGNNVRRFSGAPGGSFTIVTSGHYQLLTIYAACGDSPGSISVTLTYSDGSVNIGRNVPDWFTDPPPAGYAYLVNDLDRTGPGGAGYEDSNDPGIFAIPIPVDANRTLNSFTITRVSSVDTMSIFALTGKTPTTSVFQPDGSNNTIWKTTANWKPDTIPNGTGDGAIFNGLATANNPAQTKGRQVDVDGTVTVGSIVFNNDNPNVVGGNAIFPGTNGTLVFDQVGPGPATITVTITTGDAQTANFIYPPITLADSLSAILNNTNGSGYSLNLFGPVSGAGGLTKEGPGTMQFDGVDKTYTGPTVLNGGTLTISSSGSARPINTSSFTVNAGAVLELGVGSHTLGVGPLILNGGALVSNEVFTGAPDAAITNPITLQSNSTILTIAKAHTLTLDNTVSGPGGLSLGATGNPPTNLVTLRLEATNSYTGGTTINSGRILLSDPGASLGDGDVTVRSRLYIQTGVKNAISELATLSLSGGGTAGFPDVGIIQLDSGVDEKVGGLLLNGVAQAPGTYGSTSSPAAVKNNEYFLGQGIITVIPPGSAAAIRVVKSTNGTNNDSPPGPVVPAGSTVTFTYVVTNPAFVVLSNVTVNDDNGTPGNAADDFNAAFVSGDTNGNGKLDTNETWTFTASRTAVSGQQSSVATASGFLPNGGDPVFGTNPDNYFGSAPGIGLSKLTNGTNNNTPPGPSVVIGDTVTFTYVVTNTGNVPLSGVTLKDDNGTPGNAADDFNPGFVSGDNGDGLLDPTETWTFTASRQATLGQYTNVGMANGTPPSGGGAPVSASDSDNHLGVTAPPTPTPTPTPTATPTAAPAQILNISTRLRVDLGDQAMIAGFIITGNANKAVVLRGIGPSLAAFGIGGLLLDPVVELRGSDGSLQALNDNWKDNQRSLIEGTVFQPSDDRESVVLTTVAPAAYTSILTGKDNAAGVGLVEVYDNNAGADSQLANISTRGFVQAGNDVMIGGFILGGSQGNARIVVRGLGPSLSQFGLNPLLADPTLELHNSNGTTLIANDDWTDDAASAAQLTANGLAPTDPKESGIFTSLPAGQFTAILAGKNGGTGIGLVEVYNLR